MKPRTYQRRNTCVAFAACTFFFFAGAAFAPHLGIEDDEALFAQAIYPPRGELYSIRVGHSHVPVMLMSYVGALKSWIYRPIFRAFGTGILSLRIPVVLAGALSVWLFYLLLRRIAGERAALIGCGLLAADSMYLLTITFDWGPVALQHLLLIGGLLLLVRFYQEGSHRALGGGFFLLGLALWDKALAIWMLSGFGVAALIFLWRPIWNVLTSRRLVIATTGFVLGALPLLIYNMGYHWVTFRGNFRRETAPIAGKARMLADTAAGVGMWAWLVDEDWHTPQPHEPRGIVENSSAKISSLARHPRHHLLLYAFFFALLVTPLARGNHLRAILFALIALAVAWFQMAITAGTGGSVHHTILVWPLPAMVIAIAFAAASRRLGRAGIPAVAVVAAVVIGSGALLVNEYFATMVRNGGGQLWTDSTLALNGYLRQAHPKNIFCMDWGIYDSQHLVSRGRLPLATGSEQVSKPELTQDDRNLLMEMVSNPANLFVAHTKEYEFFPGWNDKLIQFAADAGYRYEDLAVVSDSYGRQVFDVYRFKHE